MKISTREEQILEPKKQNNDQTSEVPKTDFRDVLLESNQKISEKRKKQAQGDLSSASSYEDFLDQMQNKAKNEGMPKNKLDKDDFLKLFVTQLQQQDPLKPKDGTEMASQLAQFNSLEQMMNVNTTLTRIEEVTKNQNQKNFVNYLNKKVSIEGGSSQIKDGKIMDHSINLPVSAMDASLEVYDKNDQLVATQKLGSLPSGTQKIHWNGKNSEGKPLGDGFYRLSVKAFGSDNEPINSQILTHGNVLSVDMKNDKKPIVTEIGHLSFDEITEIH